MSGHAYEHAIRAHFLIHIVLTKILLESAEIGQRTKSRVLNFLKKFDQSKPDESRATELMDENQSRFEELCDVSKTGATILEVDFVVEAVSNR